MNSTVSGEFEINCGYSLHEIMLFNILKALILITFNDELQHYKLSQNVLQNLEAS